MSQKNYSVYRLSIGELHYFGITENINKRHESHVRCVYDLMKSKQVNWLPSETRKLFLHHKIAIYLQTKFDVIFDMYTLKGKIKINKVFNTPDKDQALLVEAFLIKQSRNNSYNCNVKCELWLIESRINNNRVKKSTPRIKIQ